MVRFVIIGIVIAVAFTLYALVDAAMADGRRARGVSKPVWVVLVVVLPVIGGVLWFTIGKGAVPAKRPTPPDDDPRFAGTRMSKDAVDEHMRDLEARLRELDDEVYPGEAQSKAQDPAPRERQEQKPAAQDPTPPTKGKDAASEADPNADDAPNPKADPEVKPNPDGDAGAARK